MHESRSPISAKPTTMPTNAPSPLGINKGSGIEPWHISVFPGGDSWDGDPRKCCSAYHANPVLWTCLLLYKLLGCTRPPSQPLLEQLWTLHCLSRQLGVELWLGIQNTLQGAVLHWTLAVGTVAGWEGVYRAGGQSRRLETALWGQEGFMLGCSRQTGVMHSPLVCHWPQEAVVQSEVGCLHTTSPDKRFLLL